MLISCIFSLFSLYRFLHKVFCVVTCKVTNSNQPSCLCSPILGKVSLLCPDETVPFTFHWHHSHFQDTCQTYTWSWLKVHQTTKRHTKCIRYHKFIVLGTSTLLKNSPPASLNNDLTCFFVLIIGSKLQSSMNSRISGLKMCCDNRIIFLVLTKVLCKFCHKLLLFKEHRDNF